MWVRIWVGVLPARIAQQYQCMMADTLPRCSGVHKECFMSSTMGGTKEKAEGSGFGLEGIVSKRLGSCYVSGRTRDWLKFKNPSAPAVKREAEEDWGREGDSLHSDRRGEDMRSIAVAAVVVSLCSLEAAAQSRSFYDATGRYVGSAVGSGRSTSYYGQGGQFQGTSVTVGRSRSYYGPGGQFQGSSINRGNTATFYGPDGHYLGSSTRTSPSPPLPLR
jgi:hypothetical protein